MEYHHLLAALAMEQWNEDTGSGPPPVVSDLEADRRAGRGGAPEPEPARSGSGRRRLRSRLRRRRPVVAATPAPAT
ncbi:hypothetical protein SAMN06297387_108162 [Streptomyces zhaozhouensis]|uniref:Uncharacterized protein n=1 Tax=Streptomyces zhaozhouensis TaxID=1300267 RepID=A0A286DWE6_9ACTN|nr:hypothetical protein [Streptomyces zhaozhouensis]SOD62999.1 hypothetical protein SAMN06297387_108162 [Streptomyces zhaozhouensis]